MAPALDPAALLRSQPFAPRVVLEAIEPVGDHAHSGTACFAEDAKGMRYKLRLCASARRAAEIVRVLEALPEQFPRVLDRAGALLLMEALEGYRALTREELIALLPEVGEMAARTHEVGRRLHIPGPLRRLYASAKSRYQFLRDVRELEGVVAGETLGAVKAKFRSCRRRYGLPVALELDDIHKANLMISERAEGLRFVDEEAVAVRPLGVGLASLVKTAPEEAHWRAFRSGYARVASPDFLTPEYTEYVLLQDTVRKVAFKLRRSRALDSERREKLDAELDDLREVAHRATPRTGWEFRRGA